MYFDCLLCGKAPIHGNGIRPHLCIKHKIPSVELYIKAQPRDAHLKYPKWVDYYHKEKIVAICISENRWRPDETEVLRLRRIRRRFGRFV